MNFQKLIKIFLSDIPNISSCESPCVIEQNIELPMLAHHTFNKRIEVFDIRKISFMSLNNIKLSKKFDNFRIKNSVILISHRKLSIYKKSNHIT